MIFVDTSFWFAAHVVEDLNYVRADALLSSPSNRLVTTDYVIDELLTLLLMRGHRPVAKMLGPLLFSKRMAEIIGSNRPMLQRLGKYSTPTRTKIGASPIALATP